MSKLNFDTSKSPQPARSNNMTINMRSYTMGNKIKPRQMFIFNEDGTIKGVREISPQ